MKYQHVVVELSVALNNKSLKKLYLPSFCSC